MSFIPKIDVGLRTKKSGRNVSCMVHGTSEIGYVLPTYCRNYINDAHIKIGTRTGIRLFPLFVPTMGKLSVRHYHDFVPFNRVWAAFDAFLAHEPYAFSAGVSIPTQIMSFMMKDLMGKLLNDEYHLAASYSLGDSEHYIPDIESFIQNSKVAKWLTASVFEKVDGSFVPATVSFDTDNSLLLALFRNSNPWNYGVTPAFIANFDSDGEVSDKYFVAFDNTNHYNLYQVDEADTFTTSSYEEYLSELSYPSLYHCDWSYQVNYNGHTYIVCWNWNGALKRLRSIFLGLGYSFNPFDNEPDNVLKLLAFYRCWFSHFGVTRSINFNDTPCAKVTRYINSTKIGNVMLSNSNMSGTGGSGGIGQLFFEFIESLLDLTYTCPPDYFTSAMQNPSEGAQDGITLATPFNAAGVSTAQAQAQQENGVTFTGTNIYSVMIAQRLLRYVNRNNVVGRKIVDILRSRYGDIKTDDESSEGVYRLGSDNTDVEIGAIYNQTDSGGVLGAAPLGAFAGVGTGGSRSKPFKFTTPSFGCLITLTAVVPEMGYFQGKLRENSDGVIDWRDFYNPDFDALGWQTVRYNELVADRCNQQSGLPSGTSLGAYGYQPRFTHLKVAFNRVLGDLSLPHMIDSMLPYTLDRYFNPRDASLPVNSPTVARKGTIGNLNRIFQVTAPTDDHIIYQIYFDISVNDSMKSLQDSYDTVTSGDNSSIEVSHE